MTRSEQPDVSAQVIFRMAPVNNIQHLGILASRFGGNGVSFEGHREALRKLGRALQDGSEATFDLPQADDDGAAITQIRLVPDAKPDEPVLIRLDGTQLVLSGGKIKVAMLGLSLINLAASPTRVTLQSVPTHLDIAYYPTHPFLAPSDVWITASVRE